MSSPTIIVNGKNYPLPDNFTFREMHTIKRLTGLRAGEIFTALESGDTDVVVALAVVAIKRARPSFDEDELLDSYIDSITIDAGTEEDAEDANPPAKKGSKKTETAAS
jgi:hypothetical protein